MQQYPNLTPENHRTMQFVPGIGAGVGGLAGGGLGALFAKLTGKINPLMGLGIGALGGALSGLSTGSYIRNAYNNNMTPEETEYLLAQDPSLAPTLPLQHIVSPDQRQHPGVVY